MGVPASNEIDNRNYARLITVKRQLGKITDDDMDEMIQASITAASRMIDSGTGRWPGAFRPDPDPSTRVFPLQGRVIASSGGRHSIIVDDISSTLGLAVGLGSAVTGVYTASPFFTTEPHNAIAKNEPISRIILPSYSLGAVDAIQVTARWGWPATPADVELATRLLAARLYRRKDSPQGVIASPDFGGIRVSRFDPDVRALLAPFVIPGFA